jgi:hypothetical protein
VDFSVRTADDDLAVGGLPAQRGPERGLQLRELLRGVQLEDAPSHELCRLPPGRRKAVSIDQHVAEVAIEEGHHAPREVPRHGTVERLAPPQGRLGTALLGQVAHDAVKEALVPDPEPARADLHREGPPVAMDVLGLEPGAGVAGGVGELLRKQGHRRLRAEVLDPQAPDLFHRVPVGLERAVVRLQDGAVDPDDELDLVHARGQPLEPRLVHEPLALRLGIAAHEPDQEDELGQRQGEQDDQAGEGHARDLAVCQHPDRDGHRRHDPDRQRSPTCSRRHGTPPAG